MEYCKEYIEMINLFYVYGSCDTFIFAIIRLRNGDYHENNRHAHPYFIWCR